MADNLTTQSGTPATVPSSSVIATDDVAGVHFQRVKLVDGTLDSNVGIAGDATHGLDVDVTRVQGTVTVGDGGGTLSVDDGGGSLTVDGTVAVSGSVTVTGPLTDTQLRATAVPVSGTFYPSIQSVSGTVGIDSATNTVKIDQTGTNNQVAISGTPTVSVTGVATETTLSAINTKTATLTGGAVPIWDNGTTISIDDGGSTLSIDDNGSSISIDDGGNVITVDGTVGLSSGTTVTLTPATSGGLTIHRRNAAGTSGDTNTVKASAGQLYGWYITNTNPSPRYMKLYNAASNPTAGAAGIVMVIMIPGNSSGAGVVAAEFSNGLAFSTGIAYTLVTGAIDGSSASVAPDEVIVNLFYK